MTQNSKGSILIGMIIVAVAMGLLIVSLSLVFKRTTNQIEKSLWQDRLRWLAYQGYIESMDSVRKEYHLLNFDTSQKKGKWGVYQSTAMRILDLSGSISKVPAFEKSVYVVVSATLTAPSALSPRHMELHLIFDVPLDDPMKSQYMTDLQDKVMMEVDKELPFDTYMDDEEFNKTIQKLFKKIIMNALKYSHEALKEFYTTVQYTPFPPLKKAYKELRKVPNVFLLRPSSFYEFPSEIQVQFWREIYR